MLKRGRGVNMLLKRGVETSLKYELPNKEMSLQVVRRWLVGGEKVVSGW